MKGTATLAAVRLALVALATTAAAGCSFDTSAFDERRCDTAIDCPVGQTCSDGICIGTVDDDVSVDPDAGDVGRDTGPFDGGTDATDASDASDTTPDATPDTSECVPGEAVCEGNVVLSCTDAGTLERLNCLSVSNCPDGEFGCYCAAGACEPRLCSPGTARCADEAGVETCSPRGDAWEPGATCADDEICVGDGCIDRQCEIGSTTCAGETIVVCGDDGQIADTTDCLADGAWCDDRGDAPICTPRACTPGETRCSAEGEAVETCDARGTGFDAPVPCDGATWCNDGLCEDQVCTPGESGCVDAFTWEVCDARGASLERVTCDAGAYCATDDAGAPVCLPQVCEPGTAVCAAGREAVQTCNLAGSAYDEAVACGDEQFCASGICNPWVCTPGDRVCDGLFAFRTCDARGAASRVTTCAEGRFCDDDGPAPTCAPQRCTPGETRCEGDAVATCDEAGSGFDAPVACGEDSVCLAGACEDVVCEAGTATCEDGVTRSACNATGTTLTTERCGAEEFCEGGACRPWICTPDEVSCGDLTTVQTCNALGSALTAVACGEGQSCADGACEDRVCAPDTIACLDAGTVGRCSADGLTLTETDCGARQTCDGGACATWVCEPDATTCVDGTTVGTCSADGLTLTETDCDGRESCDAGTCEPWVCAPSATTCADGTTVRTCSDDGLTLTETDCGGGEVCSAGACVPDDTCLLGARTCDGDTIIECTADGETVVATCALGCAAGACITGCGDGIVQAGETCDDGNTDPCDGCDSCQIDGGLEMTASTTTTSPANWTPGTSDLTIEVWARVTDAGQLIGVGEAGFDHAILGVDDDGAPYFSVSLDPGQRNVITGPTSIVDGNWHHIAGVRWATDILWLFVDGRFVAATTNNLTSSSIDRGQIWIGDYASEPGSPAAAILGDARISNTRRYTTSFAPPRIHPADASTIAAYRFDASVAAAVGAQVWASTSGARNLIVQSSPASAACYGATAGDIACGDGSLAPWEVCDDGGTTAGDGCNAACMIECSRTIGPFHNCYDWNVATQTWIQWRNTCRGRGAQLITLETALEDYWVRNWVFEDYGNTPYWIGLNDRGTEGTYEWVSGSSATFRLWAAGEPNDAPPGEDCVQAFPISGWNDLGCDASLNAICEYATE